MGTQDQFVEALDWLVANKYLTFTQALDAAVKHVKPEPLPDDRKSWHRESTTTWQGVPIRRGHSGPVLLEAVALYERFGPFTLRELKAQLRRAQHEVKSQTVSSLLSEFKDYGALTWTEHHWSVTERGRRLLDQYIERGYC